MIITDLLHFINTLSPSERRNITTVIVKNNPEKNYIILYNFILSHDFVNMQQFVKDFCSLHPQISLEPTATYLLKVLSDQLIGFRVEQDQWYKQMYGLMKTKLFFERSIDKRAILELNKVMTLAEEHQNSELQYMAHRFELSYLSSINFKKIDEQNLVNKQMKAKLAIGNIKQIHEHHSLYELLVLRLLEGDIIQQNTKNIQDLILGELNLSARGSKNQFEIQKLHLLFQSFFFIHTGSFLSALKIFKNLTLLFEANKSRWENPPYDYLSTLIGILDSLRVIKYYDEMNEYLLKLDELSIDSHTEHFKLSVKINHLISQLSMLIGLNRLEDASNIIASNNNEMTSAVHNHLMDDKLTEYILITITLLFLKKDFRSAKNQIIRINQSRNPNSLISRISHLLNILIAYEERDFEYLNYEIRAYKRFYTKGDKLYKTEKLLFKTISEDAIKRGNEWKKNKMAKITEGLKQIDEMNIERQLNKYYNFANWIKKQYS